MTSPDIIIAQNDPATSREIASNLLSCFARVTVATSFNELRQLLAHTRPNVAVLDLEMVPLDDVRELARDYRELVIVCTHHAPDEHGWMAALNAGAVEFCHPRDMRSIMRALRTVPAHRQAERAA